MCVEKLNYIHRNYASGNYFREIPLSSRTLQHEIDAETIAFVYTCVNLYSNTNII